MATFEVYGMWQVDYHNCKNVNTVSIFKITPLNIKSNLLCSGLPDAFKPHDVGNEYGHCSDVEST